MEMYAAIVYTALAKAEKTKTERIDAQEHSFGSSHSDELSMAWIRNKIIIELFYTHFFLLCFAFHAILHFTGAAAAACTVNKSDSDWNRI